jgi:hypothetical protein
MVVIRTAAATVIVTASLLDTIVPLKKFGVYRPLEAPDPGLQFVLDAEEQDQGQPARLRWWGCAFLLGHVLRAGRKVRGDSGKTLEEVALEHQ